MTLEEIKLRRLVNQRLLAPTDKLTAAQELCGFQAQFFSNAVHGLRIRCSGFNTDHLGEEMVKNWTLRGTVHLFAEKDLPLFLHCDNGRTYRLNEWSNPSFWNQRSDWALTPQRQSYLSNVVLDALAAQPMSRDELKTVCRNSGMTEAEEGSMFHPWGGGIRQLCERGFMHYAVQENKVFCLSPEFTPMPEQEAGLELARRYFTNFGPATIHDAQYFFRVSAAQVKAWLACLPVRTAQYGGKDYYYIENGRSYDTELPACILLAGFDQLMLGYEKKESLFLRQEHLREIFNLAGIVMAPVLLHGDVAGKWKRKDSAVTVELFTPCDEKDKTEIRSSVYGLWPETKKIVFR